MELIIERISRSKKLLSRHQVSGPHVSIGRGYNNDVILNDPYVDANHLLLTVNQEGRWQAIDEGSLNGSHFEHEAQLKHARPIQSGDIVALGKSHLRFIYPDHPVAPTIRLSGMEGLLNWLSSPLIVAAILLLYLTLQMVGFYIDSLEIKTSQMFSSVFLKIAVMSVLPMMFALLARLFKHDARVLTQIVVWYSFFTIFLITDSLGALISFNSSKMWLGSTFMYITELILIFALLWSAFYIAFHQSPLRRLVMVSGLTFGIIGLSYIYTSSNSADFQVKPIYDNTLLAPEFAISKPVSVQQFIEQSEGIFELTIQKAKETD